MLTFVPPVRGPDDGEIKLTSGAGAYVNWSPLVVGL
jgi:hypothetical protein